MEFASKNDNVSIRECKTLPGPTIIVLRTHNASEPNKWKGDEWLPSDQSPGNGIFQIKNVEVEQLLVLSSAGLH